MSHGLPELKGEEKRSLAMCLKNVKNHKYLVNSMHDHYDLTYTREASNLGLPKKTYVVYVWTKRSVFTEMQPDFMFLPFLIYDK